MRPSDSLKSYIRYFQNQLVKVPNCSEDVSALTFINRLHVSHLLYKHLLKHDITQMSEVMSRAQSYIKLEKAMKSSVNQSLKDNNDREKSKSRHKTPMHASNQNWGQPTYKRQAFQVLSLNSPQTLKMEQHFTALRLPINEVYNAIKDERWVRHPTLIQYDPIIPEVQEYCSYHDSK